MLPRLRQVVLVAADLEKVAARLEADLGLADPFHDAGVGAFGLHNAVFAVGDCFVEVVSPLADDAPAARYLRRQGGDAGYMAMLQVPDAVAARARLAELAVRVVWESTHDDIVDLHLHPGDVPGAIVALDAVTPPGSWRWGGPAWTAAVPPHPPGGVAELQVGVDDPAAAARRWAAVAGVQPVAGPEVVLAGGAQLIRFRPAGDVGRGIVAATLHQPDRAAATTTIGGVRFTTVPEV